MSETPEETPKQTSARPESTTEAVTPSAAHRDRRQLLVFSGTSSWMFQLPANGEVVIGRSEAADLQLPDPSISRQHARLTIDRDVITISDLGSQNGTYVNRERLHAPQRLQPGDIIVINTSTLVLQAPAIPHTGHVVVRGEVFRERIEDELERAIRFDRSFAVLALAWQVPPVRSAIERATDTVLRRIDAMTWVDDRRTHVLLAETSDTEVAGVVGRLRGQIATPELRIGYATFPDDGADVVALLANADRAAEGAEAGATISAGLTHQTFQVCKQRVIVADPEMVRLYALVERIASVDLAVLVVGHTGAGKELVANAIHERSARRDRSIVTLNCAAIPENLVESELFGHEKGAFTNAHAARIGVLEAADRSTLFLDEVGELALPTQAKLLRVLESRRFVRVGDVKEREVDVRFVAATNRDLEEEVAAGRFRQDLYFRLSGAILVLPPLRERKRELPLLAQAFLDEVCRTTGRTPMRIAPSAMRALLTHGWPGNVRELRNTMQYLAAAHPEDELAEHHVRARLERRSRPTPPHGVAPLTESGSSGELPAFRPLAEELRALEIARMRAALDATNNNQTRAAQLLSVPVRTFYEKVKQYGLLKKRRTDPSEP